MLDGNGKINGGEETVNFLNQNTSVFSSVNDAITGGSYFLGPDGRGTLTINTADVNIGQQGIETFSLVALSSSGRSQKRILSAPTFRLATNHALAPWICRLP